MKAVENEMLLRQLNWRYATQKFDPAKKIAPHDWDTLEKALISTASSFGLQPWHFVVVTSQKVKQELMAASWGQQQIVDASHVVIFASKKNLDAAHVQKYIDRISEVRSVPVEKLDGFKRAMLKTISQLDPAGLDLWSAKQAYIALGNLLTTAALMEIDSCPMEGIQPARYDQILGLDKTGYQALMVTPLGYRAEDDEEAQFPKVRFKAEHVVTHVD